VTILPEAFGDQPWDRIEPLEYEGGVRLSPWKNSKLDDWGATIYLLDGTVIARTMIWQTSGDNWRWKIDYEDHQVELPSCEGDEDFDDTEPFDREMSLSECMNEIEEHLVEWNQDRITRDRRKELRTNWFTLPGHLSLVCPQCKEYLPVGKFDPSTGEGALYPAGSASSMTCEFLIKHLGHELVSVGTRPKEDIPDAEIFKASDEGWYL
jgi:hypothetical protein